MLGLGEAMAEEGDPHIQGVIINLSYWSSLLRKFPVSFQTTCWNIQIQETMTSFSPDESSLARGKFLRENSTLSKAGVII